MKEGSAEDLRRRRLVFYEKDVEKIDRCLEEFLDSSQARCALLIDIEGHMVTSRGFTQSLDTTSIAALVAGSFASTAQLARNLGEKEFSVIFHQGENENIHISLVAGRCLLVIIFDDRTTIGMVRLYAKEVTGSLDTVFAGMEASRDDGPNPVTDTNFQREAEAKLDEFFNGESS